MAPLTKIIDCKSLEDAGCVSDKEMALVVGNGDDQRSAQADHEVRHCEAEDEHVHGLQERRVPQHHGYHQTVVEHREHCVDEHEESQYTVAHPREDGGRNSHPLGVDEARMCAGDGRHAVAVLHDA